MGVFGTGRASPRLSAPLPEGTATAHHSRTTIFRTQERMWPAADSFVLALDSSLHIATSPKIFTYVRSFPQIAGACRPSKNKRIPGVRGYFLPCPGSASGRTSWAS